MAFALPQSLTRRLPVAIFAFCALLELLSYWGWHAPVIRTSALAALALGAVVLACLDLRWLFALVLVEMVIGSHGRLFFAELGGFSVSLRMAFFAVLTLGWVLHAARGCARILHFRHAHVTAPLLLLITAITFSVLRGLSTGASLGEIFNDANGYAFMLLIPIGLDLFADRQAYAWLLRALSGAVAWLCAKSLLLLYLFSHSFDGAWLRDVFLWQRRFGLTEITHLTGGAVRVFAASDVLLLPALFLGALLAWEFRKRSALLWTALVTAAFLLSMSRSFWLGALTAAAFMLPVFVRFEIIPLAKLGRLLKVALAAIGLAVGLLGATVLFPQPKPVQNAEAWSAYGGRVLNASDAAVSSRWNMIGPIQEGIAASPLIGSGFGTQITYQSDDPRMHDLYPGGRVTTGAIEWQYLEIWLKMGVLGLIAVFWLWWRTGLLFWKTLETARGADRLVAAGFMLSFLAFIVANIFTPYLNHPLGWGFLALVIVGLHAAQESVHDA
ncbi:MAG: O-antigen ligase family protein [Patescibacteria group bacterium]|nr:MAG: O-antigen ligase family protein [Patescibacteria group bacterium]